MDFLTLTLAALVFLVLWLAWRLVRLDRALRRAGESPPAVLQLLQQEVQAVRSGVDERLREHTQQSHELSRRLGELQKATEQVEQLGAGLEELQKMLGPPGLRGAFGERLLEDLLADVLPRDRFTTQYTYPTSGVRVDAAVFVGGGQLLPIDCKFPLDNLRCCLEVEGAERDAARRAFGRDVKRHVNDVAGKYLSPQDGALDIAFMYIPSESVFHELMTHPLDSTGATLSEYALRRRVVPVSPNTLYAYLSVVRTGLRGYRLQQSARELLGQLSHLGSDVEGLRTELDRALRQARHSLSNLRGAEAALSRVELRLHGVGDGESLERIEGTGGKS